MYFDAHIPPARAQCMHAAAIYYHRPNDVLSVTALEMFVAAIARTERGKTGEVVYNKPNKDGVVTYDIGLMQINSGNLRKLAKLGISEHQIRYNECVNILVATRILQESIASTPNIWVGIGRYNSATPAYNVKYQGLVWKQINEMWSGR